MLSRFWNLFRRKRLDHELDVELRYHIESLEAEYGQRGLSAEQARMAARRDFGGVAAVEEAYRDQRGIPVLETVLRDIRFSLRWIRRTQWRSDQAATVSQPRSVDHDVAYGPGYQDSGYRICCVFVFHGT
jgi:hypothetical protein